MKTVEIEIDGPRNENLHFAPLLTTVRGKVDLRRIPNGFMLANQYPLTIPGQRIEFNLDKDECCIIDGIHDEPEVKAVLEKRYTIPERRKELGKKDRTTFLFWMKRAVESGIAKLVKGEFPKLEGKPQTNFVSHTHQEPANDKLAAALDKNTELLERLLAKFLK